MSFENFVNDIEKNNWKVHGIEVYENNELVNRWGNTTSKFPIYSITKSILSVALGIAWDRNLIDFSKPFTEYLPKEYKSKLSNKRLEFYKPVTLHRLMTMSVKGFPFRPKTDNYLEYILNCQLNNVEEPIFDYSNPPAYLCSVALTSALGQDAGEFIKNEIFTPLGIKNAVIGYSPEGIFYGPSNTELSVNDLSKIGMLIQNQGMFNNKQIVSSEYLKMAETSYMKINEGGYGYFIYQEKNAISFHGKWKQRCYILPKQNKIITFLSDIQEKCPITESAKLNFDI